METNRPPPPLTEQFLGELEDLGPADLALLRRGAGRNPGRNVQLLDRFNAIYRPLREKGLRLRRPCWILTTLYPWHPARGGRGNLGDALRLVADKRPSTLAARRIRRRFAELLMARGHALQHHLGSAVRLLATAGVPIDWRQLHRDLEHWDDPGQRVQRAWARSFLRNMKGQDHAG